MAVVHYFLMSFFKNTVLGGTKFILEIIQNLLDFVSMNNVVGVVDEFEVLENLCLVPQFPIDAGN